MQIATGMQRDRGHIGRQLRGGLGREHVLLHVPGVEAVTLAEQLTGFNQRRVVFQARQSLP